MSYIIQKGQVIIGAICLIVAFFLALGAVGGLENDTMSVIESLKYFGTAGLLALFGLLAWWLLPTSDEEVDDEI